MAHDSAMAINPPGADTGYADVAKRFFLPFFARKSRDVP